MIEIKEDANGFFVGEPQQRDAEIHYVRNGSDKIILDHTFVSDRLRGEGVGQALVKRVVDLAREKGLKIIPTCPFANSQFRRHPEWHDVLNS
ncbi:GNAT family N-acetyltransferase [Cohnella silvisoli]|uniref:GNAT family N-acetyltransferase n=1 Tax=Cohnella silvisoli TaxID=2873699 RepID=A0ABV1KTG8_9BACL|nr:GNAT family N-acetyltransferase [Cohnella silvisoli]MCD9022879.1 N-acetyltransferase [Cohnella silvisoli]